MDFNKDIISEFKTIFKDKTKAKKTEYPKTSSSKPNIFDRNKGQHYCFCINDIYKCLFVGNSDINRPPYITFPLSPHKLLCKSELGKFLLPSDLFNEISKKTKVTNEGVKPYISEKDWQEFLTIGSRNTKLYNLIFDLFANAQSGSEKCFIEKVQQHFILMLRDAEFLPELKDCLAYWAQTAFVPISKSKKAYEAFENMVNGDHECLSKTIANFFISAILGLYPFNYPPAKKTYILNSLGMEFIWLPEMISASYIKLHDAVQLYEEGKYSSAYERGMEWIAKNSKADNKAELAKAYLLLGKCLCCHPLLCNPANLKSEVLSKIEMELNYKHCKRENINDKSKKSIKNKQDDGVSFLKMSCKWDDTIPETYYLLYDYTKTIFADTAIDYLKKAFALNYAKAVIEVAFSHLRKQPILADVTEETIWEKIDRIIQTDFANAPIDVGTCLYLRGRFKKRDNRFEDAQKDFERAARKGNERARQELDLVKRNETRAFPTFSQDPASKCCFANGLTGLSYQTLSTFPGEEWALFAPVQTTLKGIQFVPTVDEFIKLQKIGTEECCRPKIVFLFMSEDKEKNLNECLQLLDKLFNITLSLEDDKDKWRLIDNTDIYVGANYETASMLIDANLSQMGRDIYFKVHIADENRDMVHKLLCEAPLFLPALNGAKSENATHVVLFGGSEMNYTFIKESIASAYLGPKHPIEITLLGENADVLEHRFKQECPGVFGCPQLTCIRPKFIKCKIRETDFPKLIYGQPQSISSSNRASIRKDVNDDIAEALRSGNYFIVDYANDLEDIRFAMELRTWLLRSKDSFDRTPFIAVKVSDKQNAYLTSHLTLAGQAAGNSYYNKYDLFPFGVAADIYHYKNIIQDPVLNKIALQIHKFYYLDNSLDRKDDDKLVNALEKCRRAAENDFYSYSYNADSSLITAIGLCYRFFAASCILDSEEAYLDFGALKSNDLLKKFEDQLNNKESKEKLAKIEQTRWNSALLVRGWLPADKTQVKNYEAQASGSSHKHILAKLHPFINEWDNLDDASLADMFAIFNQRIEYSKKPQVTTRRGIEDTTRFFIKELREREFSRGE